MTSVKAMLLALAALGCSAAFALAVLFIKNDVTKPEIWIAAMGAVVAVMALGNAVLALVITDERTRFSNAFAIARRWEEEPILSAREVFRPFYSDIAKLPTKVNKEPEVQVAFIHVTNFFWDMAAAVETGWTQSGYLRLRFRTSLDTLYPAIEALMNTTPDRAGGDALSSIKRLKEKWGSRPM